MELEKIENENRISELTEIETDNLFRSIVMGQDVTEWIDTSKGKFKVKFPRARDLEKIGKLTAMRLGGIPVASFEKNIYEFIENLAYLDVCVIDWPDWWKLAQKENPNFNWGDIPSDKFVWEVYAKAYNFRNKVQKKIDGDKEETDKRVDSVSNINTSSEPGLFDGIEGATGTNG